VAIAKALEMNRSLESLVIYDNNIETEGIAAFAKALETNTTLQRLDFNRLDDIGREFWAGIDEALEWNRIQSEP